MSAFVCALLPLAPMSTRGFVNVAQLVLIAYLLESYRKINSGMFLAFVSSKQTTRKVL